LIREMLASPENRHPLFRTGNAPAAWKTGTSQGFRDAWCCAIFDRFVLCVWMGSADRKSNPSLLGREMAAPLLFRLVHRVRELEPGDPTWLKMPESANLVRTKICQGTGLLAGEACREVTEQWFWPGVSPIGKCCHAQKPPGSLRMESPGAQMVYVAERNGEKRAISLRTNGGEGRVYWFINDRMVGSSDGNQPLWWNPIVGNHRVIAMDERGQSASRDLRVIAK